MVKVHVKRGATKMPPQRRRVIITITSLVWSSLIIVNLASMPMKAYITETLPWDLSSSADFNRTFDSFDDMRTRTLAHLTQRFDRHMFAPSSLARDSSSYALRYTLDLPLNTSRCFGQLVRFPGVVFFGPGLTRFCCAFLAQNASMRFATMAAGTAFECQDARTLGVPFASMCLWITPSNESANRTWLDVHFGVVNYESDTFAYGKWTIRCLLVVYILQELWFRYYMSCTALFRALKRYGLNNTATDPVLDTYRLDLGDPTCILLSNPIVSAVFVVDIWYSVDYIVLAGVRVTQFDDMWQYVLGCLYGSRAVWCAYFGLRYLTYIVKRCHWERHFAPLDPGVLVIVVTLYCGPIFTYIGHSGLLELLQYLLTFVPASRVLESIEIAPLCLNLMVLIATLPLMYSLAYEWYSSRRQQSQYHDGRQLSREALYSHASFNDVKTRVVFACMDRIHAKSLTRDCRGGSIYYVYERHPHYQRFPLISHRGVDCFVTCLTEAGSTRYHLSLLCCLDRHAYKRATPLCQVHPCQSVFVLDCDGNDVACASTKDAPISLHGGIDASPWVL
ncbi:Aste57867_23324 [Aphanomyces stellatus]|uniref:Aste57867_23324 protein n=1 Tax=Aphanomyces stellatus TaxID=120398 RepID=A0A485LN85_9STRA|nr:hypothetical protein As57867_023253 [Aphanomyces stellatus]VFT99969.1 Aste57867_23324 [Aphanomyces stellatus]